MSETAQFTHPETEITETRLVRAGTAFAIVLGAAFGLDTVNQELTTGSIDNSEAIRYYMVSIAIGLAAIPTHLHARSRGQAAQRQIQATAKQ